MEEATSDRIAELLADAGVTPIRMPSSGAEAILFTQAPAPARKTLGEALADLGELHERLLDLAHEIIAQLDVIEGDADFEPTLGAGELGATERGYVVLGGYRLAWSVAPRDPMKIEDTARWRQPDAGEREPDADLEPDLGSVGARDQRRWAMGIDREAEHDGREPSIGWANPTFGAADPWATGNADAEF